MSGSVEWLRYKSIISDKTHYGVIWKGLYVNERCVIKVVVLNTGIHYDKRKGKYYEGENRISERSALKAFEHDDHAPFLHTRYKKKKAMDIDVFNHEVKMIREVGNLRLAPKLLDYWINNTSRIHYGIIVMERLDMTVKDILLHRDLTSSELDHIKRKISKLHRHGIKHGDLKPSNIGVKCDNSGTIRKVKIIDWAKGEYTRDKGLFDRDIRTFHIHIKKNIKERSE